MHSKNLQHVWVLILGVGSLFSSPVQATTQASHERVRIQTGSPLKESDSLFSTTVEWRIDQKEAYRTTGMTFLNASKLGHENMPVAVAKKVATAIKESMTNMHPEWRGIDVIQASNEPEVLIQNRAGYSLNHVTFRDYSNQKTRFDLKGKPFGADGVEVAVDVVLAADVEYLDNFTSKKSQVGSHGVIEVSFDDAAPITIRTDGKTTKQIEEELSRQLKDAILSSRPLFPNLVSSDTRNNKPFDNSEIQWLSSSAKSLEINVTDPAIGVLTKFKFKDENQSVRVAEPTFMLKGLGALFVGVAGLFLYRNRKQLI